MHHGRNGCAGGGGSCIRFICQSAQQLSAATMARERVRSAGGRTCDASTSSGAMMYRLASSADKGGRAAAAETDVAVAVEPAVVDADCDCDRVCRVVACRFEGATEPWLEKTGLRGEGESK
eukprot:6213238-Pleurochrysis_carterae.AAC.1